MKERVQFLKEYNNKAEIIQDIDAIKSLKESIPQYWMEVLTYADTEAKISATIKHWEIHFSRDLSTTISTFKELLKDVQLLKIADLLYLLYTFEDDSKEEYYYVGGNPLQRKTNATIEQFWSMLPEMLCLFYETMHNGFYYYASNSMGIESIENITHLGSLDWGILEELDFPIQVYLDTSFGFFSNGMGDYIAYDVESKHTFLWSAKDQPEYSLDFWDVIDEWISIGISE